MTQTTVGRLLIALAEQSAALRDAVAASAGISPARAEQAVAGTVRLTRTEQLHIAEGTIVCAPALARHGFQLREQLRAQDGETVLSGPTMNPPVDRWERSTQLRRH